jgi:hypothetical protein
MHISGRRANPCLAMHIGRITRVLGWRSDCGVDAPNRRLMRPVRII